jgi:hypothetical protein
MDEVVTTPTTDSGSPSAAVTTTTPTTETSAAVTPTARPTSMRDAFEKAQASVSAKTGTPTTPATETTATEGKPQATKGPIPFDVHETALKNAREKSAAEAMATWRAQHGWAEQADRTKVEQAIRVADAYNADKANFVRQLLAESAADPQLAAVVRSEAARLLGASRGGSSEADFEPDIPVADANGQIVAQTYSAQKVQAIVARAVQDAMAKEVAPLKQAHEARQASETERQIQSTADAHATTKMATAQKWEGFEAHRAEVAKAYREHPSWSLEEAYLDVLHRVILPSRTRTSEAQTLASLKDKAVAQVQTTTGTAATPGKRPMSPQALAKFMEARAGRR